MEEARRAAERALPGDVPEGAEGVEIHRGILRIPRAVRDNRRTLRSSADRNLRLLIAFRALARMMLFAPWIQHYITAVRGLSPSDYGDLQSVYYIGCVLFEIPTGALADRAGRKTTLLLGALSTTGACALFALAHTFPLFVAAEILIAASTAFVSGADSALLYDTFAAEGRQAEYPRAEAVTSSAWLGAAAVGLPLAGLFLVRDGDPEPAYWATAVCGLAAAAVSLAIREPPRGERRPMREITAGAVSDVFRSRAILRVVLYSVGVFMLLRAAMVCFYNPWLDEAGVPPRFWGAILALINLGGAAAALLAPRRLRAWYLAMPGALLLMFAGLVLLRTPAAAAFFLVQGALFAAHPIVTRTLLNRHAPSAERRATVLSIESMICRLSVALLAPFAGRMLQSRGLSEAMAWTCALASLPFLLLLVVRPRRN